MSSYGPTESASNDGFRNSGAESNLLNSNNINKVSLKDESGYTGTMSQLEDARSRFLGGFTSLKSEISQLKQTIMDH